MKSMILIALFSVAIAAPTVNKETITFVSLENEVNIDGSDYDDFESTDGAKIQEHQNEKYIGTKPEDIGIASKGSYSYNFPETIITVNWITDEKTNVVHAYIQISYPTLLQNLCRSMSCTTPHYDEHQ